MALYHPFAYSQIEKKHEIFLTSMGSWEWIRVRKSLGYPRGNLKQIVPTYCTQAHGKVPNGLESRTWCWMFSSVFEQLQCKIQRSLRRKRRTDVGRRRLSSTVRTNVWVKRIQHANRVAYFILIQIKFIQADCMIELILMYKHVRLCSRISKYARDLLRST